MATAASGASSRLSARAIRLVCGGTHDERAPVPCGGVPCQDGPLVSTHRGQVRELQGPPLRAGKRLSCPKNKVARGDAKKWRSLPHVETARQDLAASRATDRRPGDTEGMEVEEEYEPASEEAMEE